MRYGILECLFRFDDQVVAQPWLCDTYEVSDDYTTWILHIREGVQFSNGNPVTPSAVQAAFERLYAETDADPVSYTHLDVYKRQLLPRIMRKPALRRQQTPTLYMN